MSTQASGTENSIERKQLVEEADSKVIKRAEWEALEFEMEAPGIVRVINGSHETLEDHSYLVNVENDIPVACECPAFEYSDGPCKHMVAVAIRRPVMEAANRPVRADGGTISPSGPRGSDPGGYLSKRPGGAAVAQMETICRVSTVTSSGTADNWGIFFKYKKGGRGPTRKMVNPIGPSP